MDPVDAAAEDRRSARARGADLLLVDDHGLIREGLRTLLETVYPCTVAEADSYDKALLMVEERLFDVALVDVGRPPHDGLWLLDRLREQAPDLPVIMLSAYDADALATAALEAGARGFVLKDATGRQLAQALETAHRRRGVYVHGPVASRLIRRAREKPITHLLSAHEIEIIGLLAGGSSPDETAAALYVTPSAVRREVRGIVEKLNVANPAQAVATALAHGLIPIRPPAAE